MAKKVYGLIEVAGIADEFPTNPIYFKQLSIQETLTIPEAKPDVEQIVSLTASVVITDTYFVNTPVGRSVEGQNLTGTKLVVEGYMEQKIEYVADEPTQSVHAAHFKVPFSTFIVIPQNPPLNHQFDVTGYIEDIFVQQLDKRTIFKNVALLLNAVI